VVEQPATSVLVEGLENMDAVKVPVTAELPRETSPQPAPGLSEVERRNQRTAELLARGEIDLAVKINLPIADSLARRYRSRGEDLDDLVQVARLGLIQAVNRFNPDNGEFLSFAVPTITGEIKRHFRDHCWTVRPPRRIQELHSEVTAAWSELAQEQASTPTPAEVADWLGMDRAEVLEAMANSTFNSASLDATDGTSTAAKDRLGMPDPGFDDVEESLERDQLMGEVRRACRRLSAEDRKILQMRFGEGATQSVIAEELGISQMSVSRRLAKITKMLRQELRNQRHDSPTRRTAKVRQMTSRPLQPTR
jgi:RNA polymerase sigma-B factor